MAIDKAHARIESLGATVKAVRDCVAGHQAVMAAGEQYLPQFLPPDPLRYAAYIKRAVWYGVTAKTLTGMLGAMFRLPPVATVPPELVALTEDADGAGQSLEQFARQIASEVWQTGRCAVLVDMPTVPAGLSAAERAEYPTAPTFKLYPFESILSTCPIRLREVVEVPDAADEFATKTRVQIRVLDVFKGAYRVRLFDDKGEPSAADVFPTRADGSTFPYIPIAFAGAINNTGEAAQPPLADIAALNLAHWRNSADYEEGVYSHGQGTLFVWSDMSAENWKALNPNGIRIGARAGHFLGANGGATLVQMQANGAAFEAMQQKERQMMALGARLIEANASAAKTATQSKHDAANDTSTLALIAANVGEAVEAALEFACEFVGIDPELVEYAPNMEFFDDNLTAQDRVAMMQELDRGLLAKADYRQRLRKAGEIDADRTDAEIDDESAGERVPL